MFHARFQFVFRQISILIMLLLPFLYASSTVNATFGHSQKRDRERESKKGERTVSWQLAAFVQLVAIILAWLPRLRVQ